MLIRGPPILDNEFRFLSPVNAKHVKEEKKKGLCARGYSKEWMRQNTRPVVLRSSSTTFSLPANTDLPPRKGYVGAHLKQESDAAEHATDKDGHAGTTSHLQSRGTAAGSRAAGAAAVTGHAGEDGTARLARRRRSGAGGRRVLACRVLGAAGVVLAAGGRAVVVGQAAVLDALVAVFLASVVGQRQRVLGHVGLLAVAADAAVGKGLLLSRMPLATKIPPHGSRSRQYATYRVAVVLLSRSGLDLLADDGACVLLILAPGRCSIPLANHVTEARHMSPGGVNHTSEGEGDGRGLDVVVGVGGGDEGRSHGEEGGLERRHCAVVCGFGDSGVYRRSRIQRSARGQKILYKKCVDYSLFPGQRGTLCMFMTAFRLAAFQKCPTAWAPHGLDKLFEQHMARGDER